MAKRKRRIVIKFGTGILTRPGGNALDKRQLARLASEVAALVHDGNECLVVSSGSVGAGMMVLGLADRPKDLASIQACAALGQSRLMRQYEDLFTKQKLHVAQMLLTHQDMDSRTRYLNAKNTLNRLLQQGDVVPIINENDTVAVEELRFGDNDRLSAEVAVLAGADLLILLTSVDGLLEPAGDGFRCVPLVKDVDSVAGLANGTIGKLSVGGMATKLQAAKTAVAAGIPAIIASGRTPGVLALAAAGKPIGTRFPVPKS